MNKFQGQTFHIDDTTPKGIQVFRNVFVKWLYSNSQCFTSILFQIIFINVKLLHIIT